MEKNQMKNKSKPINCKFTLNICKIIEICFFLFSFFCFVVGVFKVAFRIYRAFGQQSFFASVFVIVSIIGLSSILIFGGGLVERIEHIFFRIQNISNVKLYIVIFLFVLFSKLLFVFLFDIDYTVHYDMEKYLSFANQFATQGVITENSDYAVMYPYTVAFGLFLSPIAKIFGNDPKVFTSFFSILYTMISVLLFDILKDYITKTRAFLGIVLFNLIPIGLFATQSLPHESALLFFYVISFWLLYKAIKSNYTKQIKLLLVFLSAFLIAFGNTINYGGVIVVISFLIFYALNVFSNSFSAKKVVHWFFCLVIYLLCLVLVFGIITAVIHNSVDTSRLTMQEMNRKNNNLGMGWQIYLGLSPDSPGFWNVEDKETYYKYDLISDPTEAQQYQRDLIDSRLKFFIENPFRIIGHLFQKFVNLWADPYFWMVLSDNSSSNLFKSIFGNKLLYNSTLIFNTVIMLIESFINIIAFFKSRKKEKQVLSPIYQFMMVVLGITMVLMLFEVCPKYVSHMQIVLFAISLLNLDCFVNRSKSINQKLFSKLRL